MIVLASLPRCGSTYLFRSIAGLEQANHTPPDPESFGIRKTHRKAGQVPVGHEDRPIFLFGDVVEAVVSTARSRHEPGHFANCGVEYDPEADLLAEDVLGYTDLFRSWKWSGFPVLFVRYRAMRRNGPRHAIERWIGGPIDWLPWRPRRTSPTPEQRAKVESAYPELIEEVEGAPDVFLRWAEGGR